MKDTKLISIVFKVKATRREANKIAEDVEDYIEKKWKATGIDSHKKTLRGGMG